MNDNRLKVYRDFSDFIKHEARLKLWLPIVKKFKRELERPLKYFTLPGPKAFDVIRWKMEDLIKYDGRGFPEVCFCEMDSGNFNNAKRILGNTRGILDRFENIIQNKNNPKYKAFWDLFPYDVYNLDFCGTWFEDEELLSDTFVSIVELINAHVDFFIRRKKLKFNKFAIFLTLRIDRNRTNSQVIDDLKDNLKDNLSNREFSDIVDIQDLDHFIKNKFPIFMMISIPKLISSKIIPRTERYSGKIVELNRVFYPRTGYHIGKFVLIIDREKTTLRHNPNWYKEIVNKCLSISSIEEIREGSISPETKKDLENLKMEIEKIDRYYE
jgi:hypothetical protein